MPERLPRLSELPSAIPWPKTDEEWRALVRAVNPDPRVIAELVHEFPEFLSRTQPTPSAAPVRKGA